MLFQQSDAPADFNDDQTSESSTSSFLVVADSHAKLFPPIFYSSNYSLITKSISGLQWFNRHNPHVCATSLIQTSSITSLLSSSTAILFIISTNSVRTTPALEIIDQVTNVLRLIRLNHSHLSKKHDIAIVSPYPCLRTSSSFRSPGKLSSNLDEYTRLLRDLSTRLDFSLVDLELETHYLSRDGMHLQHERQKIVFNSICTYFEGLVQSRLHPNPTRRRSRAAIAARNRKRHQKLLDKQREFTLIRDIDRNWHLRDVKQFLAAKNIIFTRLPEVYRHKLRVQFNNLNDLQHAEQVIAVDQFNADSHLQWTSELCS